MIVDFYFVFTTNMFRNKYNLCSFCILSAVTIAHCRKYDIEQESRNLYGESLRSVVDRFRRTPEYLAILNDEVKELYKKLEAVGDRTAYVFSLKLYDRVLQEMGGNHTHVRTRPEELFPRMGKPARDPRISRQGQKNSPVNLLDGYNQLKHPLTLAEKNQMKELGFEYAAMAIHAMLDNMYPDDMPPMSTQLPYGGFPMDKSTTLHHHQQFTQPSTEHETAPHESHALRHATNIGRTGSEPETTSETVQSITNNWTQ